MRARRSGRQSAARRYAPPLTGTPPQGNPKGFGGLTSPLGNGDHMAATLHRTQHAPRRLSSEATLSKAVAYAAWSQDGVG